MDSDGKLTSNEYYAGFNILDTYCSVYYIVFDLLDTDEDGFISNFEFNCASHVAFSIRLT